MHSLRSQGMQPRAQLLLQMYEGVPNTLTSLMGHATPRPITTYTA